MSPIEDLIVVAKQLYLRLLMTRASTTIPWWVLLPANQSFLNCGSLMYWTSNSGHPTLLAPMGKVHQCSHLPLEAIRRQPRFRLAPCSMPIPDLGSCQVSHFCSDLSGPRPYPEKETISFYVGATSRRWPPWRFHTQRRVPFWFSSLSPVSSSWTCPNSPFYQILSSNPWHFARWLAGFLLLTEAAPVPPCHAAHFWTALHTSLQIPELTRTFLCSSIASRMILWALLANCRSCKSIRFCASALSVSFCP